MNQKQKGFTLIELLIVIAIIGILSSIVLVSLSSARTKARASAVKTEAQQIRKLFESQYAETGSYAALQTGWVNSVAGCSSAGWTGNYAAEMVRICQSIGNRLGIPNGTYFFYTGNAIDNANRASFMVKTDTEANYGGVWFCIGSSGAVYEGAYGGGPGCYWNP